MSDPTIEPRKWPAYPGGEWDPSQRQGLGQRLETDSSLRSESEQQAGVLGEAPRTLDQGSPTGGSTDTSPGPRRFFPAWTRSALATGAGLAACAWLVSGLWSWSPIHRTASPTDQAIGPGLAEVGKVSMLGGSLETGHGGVGKEFPRKDEPRVLAMAEVPSRGRPQPSDKHPSNAGTVSSPAELDGVDPPAIDHPAGDPDSNPLPVGERALSPGGRPGNGSPQAEVGINPPRLAAVEAWASSGGAEGEPANPATPSAAIGQPGLDTAAGEAEAVWRGHAARTSEASDGSGEFASTSPPELAFRPPWDPPAFFSGGPRTSGDRWEANSESPFCQVTRQPLSTFSVDVDTASYSKLRQSLMQAKRLPPPAAIRIEEMLNYFDYNYPKPRSEELFSSSLAMADCPWNERHRLVRIGLQGKDFERGTRSKANLVFLLDVSGSMDEPNKLPLVKQTIGMLARQLGENDRIALVVYAGAAGCVLPSITGDHQAEILSALDQLNAGGSTNGGQGIALAYAIAREHFIPGGINRIILCTDGDFNVGTTSTEGLVRLVEEQAKSRIFLTCLGFGMGNYNDAMMERITNRGNGTYAMIDHAREARRVMIEQLSGTLMTIAKDVKIQVEFNPARIAAYRLIGYENRRLANEDFNQDEKDAGEIGAGHRVTALYEIVPAGVEPATPPIDDLRYRSGSRSEEGGEPVEALPAAVALADEWLTLKVRYKLPEGDRSRKLEFYLKEEGFRQASGDADFAWAQAVAEFGLLLRRSPWAPQADWGRMLDRAQVAAGENADRLECVELMTIARRLAGHR
jgi:Ca-activated chloride channel family protein